MSTAPTTVVEDTALVSSPLPNATSAMPANAASNPSFCLPGTGCLRRSAANTTTKTGMVAEMMVPTEADVPATPKAWATWPAPMPSTPRAATRGSARRGSRCLPRMKTSNNGTASEPQSRQGQRRQRQKAQLRDWNGQSPHEGEQQHGREAAHGQGRVAGSSRCKRWVGVCARCALARHEQLCMEMT